MSKVAISDKAIAVAGFQALSDPTRVDIVTMLRAGELCVCELIDALDIAQSRLSFHLRVLKDARLVTDRKDGRWVYYTLNTDALEALKGFLEHLRTSITSASRTACCT